ncbi:MAG TPA: bifunctional oligoribonuclease/PAP phosphatase NrnA [Terriglobales bacterium]
MSTTEQQANLDQVLREIQARQRFLLTSHARPDGDAVGSALACCQILRSMGKHADVVMSDGVPRIYKGLPFASAVLKTGHVNGTYEAAILLECDNLDRTRLQGLQGHFLISIDHHHSGKPFADVNWIDPNAVATAEMIYRLGLKAGVKITPEIATCVYTAVVADTGSFMFAGTNEHTFALARELVMAGADPVHCARNIYFAHSTAKMRLLGSALSNLHREGCLAWIWVTQEQMKRAGAREEDCEGLVNYALSIQDVEVAAFFRELPDSRFRVSLRSKGQLNVAAIAEKFGGGGHECASGLSVNGPLAAAVSKVIEHIQSCLSVQ